MLREVESAQDEAEALEPRNDQERSQLDGMLSSFTAVSAAIRHSRGALASPADSGTQSLPLSEVQSELRRATEQLDGQLAKAGIP